MGRTTFNTLSACKVGLHLYLCYGMYASYRAAVLHCTAKLILPLWAVYSVHCLSARTLNYNSKFHWAVRHIQSFSLCTVKLTHFSPMEHTACSVPQWLRVHRNLHSTMGLTVITDSLCLYSISKTLLQLWVVRLLQRLRACKVQLDLNFPYGPFSFYTAAVTLKYNHTSTPYMSRSFSTELQCLYSTFIPLISLGAVQTLQNLSALQCS